MSSHWKIRISVCTVICVAMLAYALVDSAHAQKRGIRRPPDAGGAPDAGDQDEKVDPRRARPQGNRRPSGVGDRRGGNNPGAPDAGDNLDRPAGDLTRQRDIALLSRGLTLDKCGNGQHDKHNDSRTGPQQIETKRMALVRVDFFRRLPLQRGRDVPYRTSKSLVRKCELVRRLLRVDPAQI